MIPLADDLSNAIIATCKGPYVAKVTPVPTPPTPAPIPTPRPKSVIFDDVWHTSTTIPDAEHQVSQLQNGKINYSDQTTGPTGDFHPGWKYVEKSAPANQPFQKAGNEWDAA